MWGCFAAIVLLTAVAPPRLVAMNIGGESPNGRCVIIGGEKLSPESIGSAGICGEVEAAIASRAPTVRYSAQIRVLSPTRLAATLIVNDRTLPVQNFAVMDGKLSNGSIKRFAAAVALAVAGASKR